MTPGPAWDAVRPGDTLADKYVVERVIGRGGMGIVLAARDTVLGTRVAVKVVQPGSATAEGGNERFLREARAAALLQGENAVRVLDVGTHPELVSRCDAYRRLFESAQSWRQDAPATPPPTPETKPATQPEAKPTPPEQRDAA